MTENITKMNHTPSNGSIYANLLGNAWAGNLMNCDLIIDKQTFQLTWHYDKRNFYKSHQTIPTCALIKIPAHYYFIGYFLN